MKIVNMKVVISLIVLIANFSFGQERILVLGNSLSSHLSPYYDMPRMIEVAGHSAEVGYWLKCGTGLSEMLESPYVNCNPSGSSFFPTDYDNVLSTLTGEAWDRIIFQFHSTSPFWDEYEALESMLALQMNAFPGHKPQIYIYSTWPDVSEMPFLVEYLQVPTDRYDRTQKSMSLLQCLLDSQHPEWAAEIIPVGEVFYAMRNETFESFENIDEIYGDVIHLKHFGRWIALKTVVAYLFDVNPQDIDYKGNYAARSHAESGMPLYVVPDSDLDLANRVIMETVAGFSAEPCPEINKPSVEIETVEGGIELSFQSQSWVLYTLQFNQVLDFDSNNWIEYPMKLYGDSSEIRLLVETPEIFFDSKSLFYSVIGSYSK